MRFVTRMALALLLAAFAVTAGAPVAGAQAEDEPDNIVVVTGRAEVREGETVDNVFIADGPVVIDGTVRDALVVLNGTSSSAAPPARTSSPSTAGSSWPMAA